MANDRLNWSRKRVITLVLASGVTALILGYAINQMAAGHPLHQGIWLVAFANMVQWCAYLAATVREGIHADMTSRVEKLRDQIREEIRTEVAKLLKPIDSKIEEIDADVHAYGDQREANGVALAARIVGQHGKNGRAHLYPVE